MNTIEDRSFVNLDVYAGKVEGKKPEGRAHQGVSRDESSGDKVELSRGATQILEAKKMIDSVPDVREKKIDDIKIQIASGTYQIKAKETAFRILRESLLNDSLL